MRLASRRLVCLLVVAPFLVALATGLSPIVSAGEEPAKPVADEPKPADPAATPEAAAPADAPAEPAAPETPKAAFQRVQTEARKAGNRMMAVQQELASAYLADVEKRGAAYEGEEAVSLGRLQALAGKRDAALATFRALLKAGTLPEELKDEARKGCIDMVLASARSGDLKEQALADAICEAEGLLGEMQGERNQAVRGQLHLSMGMALAGMDRSDDALEHFALAGLEQPMLAPRAANLIIDHLLEEVTTVDAYPAVRSAGRVLLSMFSHGQDAALASARKAGNEQLVKSLENARKRLQSAGVPLDLVGNALPAWTVAHSFQGGNAPADYKGKVVLVDFWATWCPWCIKSFPAMRQLLREYGEKGFAIVGVTASAGNVFDARYDLDEDVKGKAGADWKPAATLRLAQDADAAAKAEFKEKEKDVIATFLKNHEIPWDVVMITEEEPAAKYGLAGWPYGIVLDKQGRVRRLHAGALLKDNAEQMAEMRKLLEALLAE